MTVVCRPGGDPTAHSPTTWKQIDQELVTHSVAVIAGALHPLHLVNGEPHVGSLADYAEQAVLRGWIHGYHHLRLFVEQIEAGTAEPVLILDSRTARAVGMNDDGSVRWEGKYIEWPAAAEFAYIAAHGFIPLYRRVCKNTVKGRCSIESGWEQQCSFLDPSDPSHPRFHEF
jgi:hypothetical protein